MRIATIIGTRPQVIKAAALEPLLRSDLLIDTGQHADPAMAGDLYGELGLRAPDILLRGGSMGSMTDAIVDALRLSPPDRVLVLGDTDSTLAGALAGARLGIPVAHVEAGLRSFDRTMPEEGNRIATDHLSTWCFAPTDAAMRNLDDEGIDGIRTGDLLADLLWRQLPWLRAQASPAAPYAYATIHRAANRTPAAIAAWTAILRDIPVPVRLALHPGTRAVLDVPLPDNVILMEPQGYLANLLLVLHASAVLTDSGGVQREASWLGTPCILLRGTTEWPECGSFLVGLDRDLASSMFAAVRDTPRGISVAFSGTAQTISDTLR